MNIGSLLQNKCEKGKDMLARIIYLTEKSKSKAEEIKLKCQNKLTIYFSQIDFECISYRSYKENTRVIFEESDFLIFIMATGIVVRSICPYIKDKFSDPGILVIDENAQNIISLLSGHVGGANQMCRHISHIMGANPVITTSTDSNSLGAFDTIAKNLLARVDNFRDISLKINSSVLKTEEIDLIISKEYYDILICIDKKIFNGFNVLNDIKNSKAKNIIYISDEIDNIEDFDADIIKIIPRINVLGVGCRKGKDSREFEGELIQYLRENNISIESISKIASIDIKKDEKCIRDFAEKYDLECVFFSREEIARVDYKYEKSEFVKETVGVYSVAEPACDLLCKSNIIAKNKKNNGVSLSLGRMH